MLKALRSLSIAICIFIPLAASSQSSQPECSPGFANLLSLNLGDEGAFTFTAKLTFEHRLLDGGAIRGFSYEHVARNSQGQHRSENPISCDKDKNGQPHLTYSVDVDDPSQGTMTMWMIWPWETKEKVAYVRHQRPMKQLPHNWRDVHRTQETPAQLARLGIEQEDLGVRNIAGVEVHGKRRIRTIPTGQEGNDVPLRVITETWFSDQYGLDMAASQDDPRIGKSSYEITSFTPGEPDAALFTPPADYKIQDRNPVAAASDITAVK